MKRGAQIAGVADLALVARISKEERQLKRKGKENRAKCLAGGPDVARIAPLQKERGKRPRDDRDPPPLERAVKKPKRATSQSAQKSKGKSKKNPTPAKRPRLIPW